MNININPNSELHQSIVNVPDMVQVPEMWVDQARQFQQAMMRYTCAIREVKTKLEVLNDELSGKEPAQSHRDDKVPCEEAQEHSGKAAAQGIRDIIGVHGEKLWMMWPESGLSVPSWMISMKWRIC